jgi:hypothetical protein
MAAARKQAAQPVKVVDECAVIRCAAGRGLVREEVWEDCSGNVVRYNLAFIQHELFAGDHGRVLGYDNAHGSSHRHFAGRVEAIAPARYGEILQRFLGEIEELRKRTAL